jgi:hypothetical protein
MSMAWNHSQNFLTLDSPVRKKEEMFGATIMKGPECREQIDFEKKAAGKILRSRVQ